MLTSLHIVNFAIIEDTVMEFESGATIFTGETGAGKSILMDALSMLTGRRASTELIRSGTDYFKVEGVFECDESIFETLSEIGLEPERQLVISRKMNRAGRGTCMVNGDFVTVKQLEVLGKKLVRLHEQNDTGELLSADFCQRLTDTFTPEIREARGTYDGLYRKWKETKTLLDDFANRKQENERRLDILEWELQQINEADVKEGEDEEIEKRLTILENHERIFNAVNDVMHEIADEDGAQDRIALAKKSISSVTRFDEGLSGVEEALNNAVYALEDAMGILDSYAGGAEFSEEELSELQSRSELLRSLKRKYGPELADVIAYRAKATEEYNRLRTLIYDNESLRADFKKETDDVMAAAEKLNALREKTAKTLTKQITASLKDMGMEHARLSLHLVPSNHPTAYGADEMELYFSANVGEPLRSMRETASGGEISRIALAIEVVMTDFLKSQTLIFDEIDVGISGRVGLQVARKIKALSRTAQVLCITHLPQTASIAERHYQIVKTVEGGRTSTRAVLLSAEEHLRAVSQMISGTPDSESAYSSAVEMKNLLDKC